MTCVMSCYRVSECLTSLNSSRMGRRMVKMEMNKGHVINGNEKWISDSLCSHILTAAGGVLDMMTT